MDAEPLLLLVLLLFWTRSFDKRSYLNAPSTEMPGHKTGHLTLTENCSPDSASVLADHRLSFVAAEGLREVFIVLHDAIYAEASRGVWVGLHLLAQGCFRLVLAPYLSIANEGALFWSEALDCFRDIFLSTAFSALAFRCLRVV